MVCEEKRIMDSMMQDNSINGHMIKKHMIKECVTENATLWILSLDEASEADFEKMYALCDRERREKADKIKQEAKRKQSVGAGYLLALLKERFSIEEEPVLLPGGKPVFPGKERVHFNISHSRGAVVLAFGDRPLGVDIEYIDRANLKLAKRFFTGEEYVRLLEQDEERQGELFYRIWTGKEAVIKAAGCGLALPLDCFSVWNKSVLISGRAYELCRQKSTGEGSDHLEEEYELCWQKVLAGGQNAWICVAQLITDSSKTIRCNPGRKEKTPYPEASASAGLLLSEK